MISFVGAGPGAADLITVRGAARLAAADVVVYAGSLVPDDLLASCRPDALLLDSKGMVLEDVTAVFEQHPDAAIVRLHSGDPTIYGAIAEQLAWCRRAGRDHEIVPGVSSLTAAAAAAGCELTVPGVSQSVIATRLADRTAASLGPGDDVAALAAHGATMALFLSVGRPEALQEQLLSASSAYGPDTPALVAHHVSRPDQRLATTTVGELAATIAELGITMSAIVLVGAALGATDPQRAHVYASDYAHSYRSAEHGPTDRG